MMLPKGLGYSKDIVNQGKVTTRTVVSAHLPSELVIQKGLTRSVLHKLKVDYDYYGQLDVTNGKFNANKQDQTKNARFLIEINANAQVAVAGQLFERNSGIKFNIKRTQDEYVEYLSYWARCIRGTTVSPPSGTEYMRTDAITSYRSTIVVCKANSGFSIFASCFNDFQIDFKLTKFYIVITDISREE